MKCTIYVPVSGTAAARQIAPKSAIVAVDNGRSPVFHFEGNVYNAENLKRFIERLITAAGRLSTNYPTMAKAGFNPSELKAVGTFNSEFNCITELTDAGGLEAWAGEEKAQFAGEVLPIGRVPVAGIGQRMLESARYLGRSGGTFAYRTLAGQLLIISSQDPKTADIRAVCEKWEK